MGITLHFHGRIAPKIKPREVWIYATLIGKEKGWPVTDLIETNGTAVLQQHDGEEISYTGKLFSFTMEPHEHCEPVIFQITEEGYFKNWCKTQFAPPEIHIGLVDFFQQMKIKFCELVIQDEGGFWELRDPEVLEERIVKCFLEMQASKDEDPEYYGPVKIEGGRITDLMK
ncbi:MAG: hypothetical protein JWP91_2746 [Fibrobacteres bacterium]|nr:hypothetical protein [Fibrobacterota bacterium]